MRRMMAAARDAGIREAELFTAEELEAFGSPTIISWNASSSPASRYVPTEAERGWAEHALR